MFALLILLVAIIATVCMVVSADNETFILEKKEYLFSFVDSIKEGMSLEEVENKVVEVKEIEKPILDSCDFETGKYNYYSYFKFEEGFAVYDGVIKFYFVYDELTKVEVIKK